jgi:hypothetical protein
MASTAKEKLEGLFKVGVGGRSLKGSEYVADVEKMLVTNVSEAMTRLGYKIIDNITKYAPVDQGILNNPRTFEVLKIQETKIGYRLEIKVNADYVDYVDKGV